MLYLTRKVGETIIINNNIEVTIMEIKGKTVKIGFSFPQEATVLRKETHDKITQENIAASTSIPLEILSLSSSSEESSS